MTKRIALIPGDGIGPEIVAQAKAVLDRVAEIFGSRFALRRIFRLFRPTDRRIRRTEPCGLSHDGGPEPYGRWK